MDHWKTKVRMRMPALVLCVATLVFWTLYDRYEPIGLPLVESPPLSSASRLRGNCSEAHGRYILDVAPGGPAANVYFTIPDGEGYELLRVRGRMKTTGVVIGPNKWRCARLLLIQYDGSNKWIPGHHGLVAEVGTTDWTRYEDVFEMDPRADRVDLVIQQTGAEGVAEFDQLMVERVRLRPSFFRWRALFIGLWLVTAVRYYTRCRLNRRRLRMLILLNALAIIAGTLMPEPWIEETIDFTKQGVAKVSEVSRAKDAATQEVRKPPEKPGSEQSSMEEFSRVVGGVHGAGHFILFASLCFLVYLSAALEHQPSVYYVKVALDVMLFAAATESLQHLTLDRTPGLGDWLRDLYGMALAFVLFLPVKQGLIPGAQPVKKDGF